MIPGSIFSSQQEDLSPSQWATVFLTASIWIKWKRIINWQQRSCMKHNHNILISFSYFPDMCGSVMVRTFLNPHKRHKKVASDVFGMRCSPLILWLPNTACHGFRQSGSQDHSCQTPSLYVLMFHGGPPTHCWSHILKTSPHGPEISHLLPKIQCHAYSSLILTSVSFNSS